MLMLIPVGYQSLISAIIICVNIQTTNFLVQFLPVYNVSEQSGLIS